MHLASVQTLLRCGATTRRCADRRTPAYRPCAAGDAPGEQHAVGVRITLQARPAPTARNRFQLDFSQSDTGGPLVDQVAGDERFLIDAREP
jgi:hypothetical protein